ncbi:MAG: ABC transporter ATP-binding protein [Tepidisphaeraceae bacterium]
MMQVETTVPIIRVNRVAKRYRMGDSTLNVLRGVDLVVNVGEFLAIEGRSGSGKSTLLHLMGLLDVPDEGSIEVDGVDAMTLGESGRARLRNTDIGFVFQFYHLLPELNVLQNTMLASMVQKGVLAFQGSRSELRDRAAGVLETLGLKDRMKHRPSQLSGGERQRVAIGRALMNKPRLLLADEPTGNLDAETGRQIMDVIEKLHLEQQQTVVMVTHDRTLAREADRVLMLKQGLLVTAES